MSCFHTAACHSVKARCGQTSSSILSACCSLALTSAVPHRSGAKIHQHQGSSCFVIVYLHHQHLSIPCPCYAQQAEELPGVSAQEGADSRLLQGCSFPPQAARDRSGRGLLQPRHLRRTGLGTGYTCCSEQPAGTTHNMVVVGPSKWETAALTQRSKNCSHMLFDAGPPRNGLCTSAVWYSRKKTRGKGSLCILGHLTSNSRALMTLSSQNPTTQW